MPRRTMLANPKTPLTSSPLEVVSGGEGEVAAVDEPVAVEQHQAFGGHGSECSRGPACQGARPGASPRRRRRSARPPRAWSRCRRRARRARRRESRPTPTDGQRRTARPSGARGIGASQPRDVGRRVGVASGVGAMPLPGRSASRGWRRAPGGTHPGCPAPALDAAASSMRAAGGAPPPLIGGVESEPRRTAARPREAAGGHASAAAPSAVRLGAGRRSAARTDAASERRLRAARPALRRRRPQV